MMLRSPSNIKYNITFCAKCKLVINSKSDEQNCDNCKKLFHKECNVSNRLSSELIWMCDDCRLTREICTSRDTFEIKTTTCESNRKATKYNSPCTKKSHKHSIVTANSRTEINDSKQQTTKEKPTSALIASLERKIAQLDKRVVKTENKKCDCSKNFEMNIAQINKLITEAVSLKTASTVFNSTDGLKKKKKKRVNKKKKLKNIFDSITTTTHKIDSCEAIIDTCLSLGFEIQKQILEINNQLDKYEAMKCDTGILGGAIYDFGNALKQHNNTIKTHLKLSDSYNSAVMKTIESEMNKIANLSTTTAHSATDDRRNEIRNDKSLTQQKPANVNKQRSAQIVVCDIGKVSIRPLEQKNRICNQIRIHIYDTTCKSLDEARTFLSNLITSFKSSIMKNNIKWCTTKMAFNQNKHYEFKRINLIATLPEQLDIAELKSHMECVFANFGS